MRAYRRKMPSSLSNNDIYNFILKRIDENNEKKRLEISTKLIYVNINSVADKCISALIKGNLINEKDEIVRRFKRRLLVRNYNDTIIAKLKAEFYSALISSEHWADFSKINKLQIDTIFKFIIKDGLISHNLYVIVDEVKSKFVISSKKRIEILPLNYRKSVLNTMIESAIDSDHITKSNSFDEDIEYLKNIRNHYQDEINSENEKQKIITPNGSDKFPAKYYALYHWILIVIGKEKHFERNNNDLFIKNEIVTFAKNRYKEISSQMFYISFRDIDITNKVEIAKMFGKGYKNIIIKISNDDTDVIKHLKKFPN